MDGIDMQHTQNEIAVIGMACHLPGACNPDEFWRNLRDGVESISFLSEEELSASGVDVTSLNNPQYVKATAVLEGIDLFDAAFFSFTPREAEITDPQHRLFLECAWEALENAGYAAEKYRRRVGVYAGISTNTYLSSNLHTNADIMRNAGSMLTTIGNEKDHLAARVSYKLNLKGPSICVSTACSTSLVAIHLACQSLLNGESDMALAGGVSIKVPQKVGYTYVEGGVGSPDGHCRAFDAEADGTVAGNGVGVVLLKRLEDALADGDCIHAVIKGSAINNDGARKVGYTAPSVTGQAEVIAEAQAIAGISPEMVTYIEAHGAGTSLGDPIEVAALTTVFQAKTSKKHFCAIGSVKTNVGHLDVAAGVTGFIKTVLALKNKALPPSLHFERPNPEIRFEDSPFYVSTMLSDWQTTRTAPRRAGVSAFGIGGTNAHVILEEAPYREPAEASRPCQLLLLSAKTETALQAAKTKLAAYIFEHPDLNLADAAYTLQVGRKEFQYRSYLACTNAHAAANAFLTPSALPVFHVNEEHNHPGVLFLLPGQRLQHMDVALGLYQHEVSFRKQIDHCAKLLEVHLGFDLRTVLYPDEEQIEEASHQLNQLFIAQPALFVIEYALATLWMEWGVRPEALIGYDLGEYVAACLAGVLSLQDALALVVAQGRLLHELPAGAMLVVSLSEEDIQPFLGQHVSLAAKNSATECVLSGSLDAIEQLERQLSATHISYHRLDVPYAAHSYMLDHRLEHFIATVKKINLMPPKIPYISSITGNWITERDATDPRYWGRHLRETVRFAEGMRTLASKTPMIMLALGPGEAFFASTYKQFAVEAEAHILLQSLHYAQNPLEELTCLLDTCGRLWSAGIDIDWPQLSVHEKRTRIPLPTYSFERTRYWIDAALRDQSNSTLALEQRAVGFADWFSIPSWKRSFFSSPSEGSQQKDQRLSWLVFVDECGVGDQLIKRLKQENHIVVTVKSAKGFSKLSDQAYALNPREESDYADLFKDLQALNMLPEMILHLWSISQGVRTWPEHGFFKESQYTGFYSLLYLVRACGKQNSTYPIQIRVLSNGVQDVESSDTFSPEKSTLLGACAVIPQEYGNITCQHIDVLLPEVGSYEEKRLIEQIMTELDTQPLNPVLAYRDNYRWVQTFEPIRLEHRSGRATKVREHGVYLIIGGLGKIGLILAKWLAQNAQARLILTGRSGLPPKEEWESWLATHDASDLISNRINKVKELTEMGTEVLVIAADVANSGQMRAAIAQSTERFGTLHGVFHAAAVVEKDIFLPICETSYANSELHFQSKVYGLFVLEEVLREQRLDFCLLLSSLAAIVGGGPGFMAYAAANIFMDAYSRKLNREQHMPWISVDWDGRATPEETIRVFQGILSTRAIPQVIVSTTVRLWMNSPLSLETRSAQNDRSAVLNDTPGLPESYVAPQNELEQQIANIWRNVLGIDQVGVNDNLFELGGSSLMAIQIIRLMQEVFQVVLSMKLVFDNPTIARLAQVVVEKQIELIGAGQMAELMRRVDQISEEDALFQLEENVKDRL